jgi:pilus assembly protein TadC
MRFNIPFTFSSPDILKKKTKVFANIFRSRKGKLDSYLTNLDVNLTSGEYRGICLRTFLISFVIFLIISSSALELLKIKYFYLYSLLAAFLFSAFIFINQTSYPRVYNLKKTRDIERNLIPALQDMLVQLESGVPIFQIIANIAASNYGFVSYEFKKAVNEINSGISQIDALESLIKRNSSTYFKRILWQLSNGLRSGSDMSMVLRDIIDNLNKEQAIQIQSYGSKLNPLIMFYMLITVILPSLGITFLTIISSMLNLSSFLVEMLFVTVFVFVLLMQILFLGLIKTRRPSLL